MNGKAFTSIGIPYRRSFFDDRSGIDDLIFSKNAILYTRSFHTTSNYSVPIMLSLLDVQYMYYDICIFSMMRKTKILDEMELFLN